MPQVQYDLDQAADDISTLRGQIAVLPEYAEIATLVVAGVVVAQQPATSTEPQTQETWHAFNPLSNSWAVPSNGYADYRITPMNELQIWAWIRSPLSSTVNGVTIATFPVGYRPQVTVGFPVVTDLMPGSYLAANGSPGMTITTAGVLQSTGVGGNGGTGANVYINVKIPLDIPV